MALRLRAVIYCNHIHFPELETRHIQYESLGQRMYRILANLAIVICFINAILNKALSIVYCLSISRYITEQSESSNLACFMNMIRFLSIIIFMTYRQQPVCLAALVAINYYVTDTLCVIKSISDVIEVYIYVRRSLSYLLMP